MMTVLMLVIGCKAGIAGNLGHMGQIRRISGCNLSEGVGLLIDNPRLISYVSTTTSSTQITKQQYSADFVGVVLLLEESLDRLSQTSCHPCQHSTPTSLSMSFYGHCTVGCG